MHLYSLRAVQSFRRLAGPWSVNIVQPGEKKFTEIVYGSVNATICNSPPPQERGHPRSVFGELFESPRMALKEAEKMQDEIKNHEILYEHYRTIAYERANPLRLEYAVRDLDPSFGRLLPTNLDARILDIGCGMGQFLHYLALKGYRDLAGVELSAEQAEFCRENGIPNVSLTSDVISFLTERSHSWQCIVFKDVIEHLPRKEVIATLSAIFQALTPGGSIIIETGNLASPAGMFVRYIDFTHESGFTENSLRQILRAVGFGGITVRGNSPVIYSWRSYFRVAVQWMWHKCLRLLYSVDRGWGAAPRILSPVLIAHAVRPLRSERP